MDSNLHSALYEEFGISNDIVKLSEKAEKQSERIFSRINKIKEYNQLKVIKAMQDNNLSGTHFSGTTGYGYGDRGREVLDSVYADVFKAESALVRQQIVAGTHALAICLYGNLRPGDELLSVTGKPYDTLEEIIGIRGAGLGSLKEWGVSYRQVDLLPEGQADYDNIKSAINEKTKMVFIQRSRGYTWRPSLKIDEIKKIIEFVKNIRQDVIVMVDNCYGEFVEEKEPTEVGADLIAGSLIKNPGGGLALTGGYIAGKKLYVERAACRLIAPGIGSEIGPTLGQSRLFFQGLFLAPHIVAESLRGAVFCSSLMEMLGLETSPNWEDERSDIIQGIKFGNPDMLISFCQGIQKGSPVDSFVSPEPWDMPGYDCPVIMASGAFVQGSSIELSADGPVKPPYIAYMQGGMVYEHVKLGIMVAVQMMKNKKML
ncbi:MAG TPA: hypothetical protein GXX20_02285 [Clostridiaceae bacterium]|nr:hypothetical protein [Clostridiaceae bacterium]